MQLPLVVFVQCVEVVVKCGLEFIDHRSAVSGASHKSWPSRAFPGGQTSLTRQSRQEQQVHVIEKEVARD